ncbi:hypothetical protein KSD_46970 [Ktedonobacter sp. SOSP1-85]|uniref:hypothetical protein n=1 Tax=Ktedonobacter sp. SOSP1-85 TaxID=2778367 RepID=UPI0019166900|nr:hypothetical protein [Ktedonobacter sp. SOSP1-85]GHO76926.1 hypothetical protein KSD_46970 [Ktedonobacter sp. SOSP1-85]
MHRISTENEVCDQGWMQRGNCGTDLMLIAFHGALRQHKSESAPVRFAVGFAVNDALRKKKKTRS